MYNNNRAETIISNFKKDLVGMTSHYNTSINVGSNEDDEPN